ncbi:hypothetical protein [Aeromonas salmonicida]|uniref:hypothetical protein n=1 Tax=Aeromonas salmonicida TaxID=645 RepID=UPI001BA46EEF|nr:hypothetical protein [Aeromonas salmonicida]MBS2784366.1 hypothetical protein [Aeromonas salmonicida]
MAMHNVTENSYHALDALSTTVCALAELAEIIPSEDRYASLVRILAERLEADMEGIRRQVYELWQFVPEVPGSDGSEPVVNPEEEDVAV